MLATSPRTAPVAPQEGIDHLFLLPKRVLDMDNISLRKDLAGLDFDYQLFQNGPKGNVWLCKCSFCLCFCSVRIFLLQFVGLKILICIYFFIE